MSRRDGMIDFVHSGPDTLAGRYLRRYWQPLIESKYVETGAAKPVRVMHQDLVVYRGTDRMVHVMDARCPHRGTHLAAGWVEGSALRCYYHGWLFDHDGRCLEQPAEPKPFCHKISINPYPAEEQLGLVFAYLGPLPAPPLPRWPEFDNGAHVASIARLPCNYFQSAENIVDDVHVGFVHGTITSASGATTRRTSPIVAAEETDYGIQMTYTKPDRTERSHYMMPNSHTVSYYLDYVAPGAQKDEFRMRTLFWYVPIDDESHNHVMVTAGHPDVVELMRAESEIPHDVAADILAVLSGAESWHKTTGRGARRPDLVRIQDGVSVVGQGAIADRRKDRLGASDAGVILLRKLWTRELRSMSQGQEPKIFACPASLPV
jgi:5,5'-dehydrodivanillate O-demethylase